MSEFDDALQALDDAIYLFTKPGGGHTDTGKRLIAAKAEFKACRQALVTATLEQSGAIFQVQKLQAELLNHRHSGGDGEDSARLDYIERTFSGMTNRERYLPVVMIWGKGANGRTLREACDKYMAKDVARAGERG